MERYLGLKAQGWYRKNNYHIIVATEAGEFIAGAIADFLAEANAVTSMIRLWHRYSATATKYILSLKCVLLRFLTE